MAHLSNDLVIGKLVGKMTKKGKRSFVEKQLLHCIKELHSTHQIKNPLEFLTIVLDRIAPLVEIKSKKVGGTVYRIPKDINDERALAIGVKWLLESLQNNKGKSLIKELLLISSGQGKAVERVREVHEFAKKNRGLVKFL